jgi:undecaprenyl-diphosphatase
VVRRALADAVAGWRALPDATRRSTIRTLGAGVLLLVVATLAAVFGARRLESRGVLAGEPALVHAFLAAEWISFSGGVWLQALGTDLFLAAIVLTGAVLSLRAGRPLTALALVLAFVGMDLAVRLGWSLWARPRPTVVFGGQAAPGFHAFPSGHAGKTVAVWGLLAVLWVRSSGSTVERLVVGSVVAAIMVLVPLARLRMGAHWPSDLVGGAFLGFVWLGVLVRLVRLEAAVARGQLVGEAEAPGSARALSPPPPQ